MYSATTTAVVQASTGSPGQEESNSASEGAASGVFKVIMMKGATGVGFCLEGGKGSPKGDVPIIVKRIFKGKKIDINYSKRSLCVRNMF